MSNYECEFQKRVDPQLSDNICTYLNAFFWRTRVTSVFVIKQKKKHNKIISISMFVLDIKMFYKSYSTCLPDFKVRIW